MVFASTLGDLFCRSSTLRSDMRSLCALLRKAFVSSLVLKLFISTKRTCTQPPAVALLRFCTSRHT